MSTTIITGGSGLIGSEVLRQIGDGHSIIALGRHRPAMLPAKAQWLEHDFTRVDCLPEGPVDTIIHLSQSSHFRDFPAQALDVFDVNVRSTALLLDHAVRCGAKRFVFASSGGIYGFGEESFTEEHSSPHSGALSHYLGGKLCGEVLCESYAGLMTIIILRFFFVYGPQQRADMLIPRLIGSVTAGRPITLQGPDGLRLNPIHVKDAARGVLAAAQHDRSEKINVGGTVIYSLREVAEAIGRHVGKAPHFEISDGTPRSLIGDINKMERLLHRPVITLEQGLATMPVSYI